MDSSCSFAFFSFDMAIRKKYHIWNQAELDSMLSKGIGMLKEIDIPISQSINPHIKVISDPYVFGLHQDRKYFEPGDDFNYEHQICISAAVLGNSEKSMMNTVLHELIHTIPGCTHDNGGKLWLEYTDKVNKYYGFNISVRNNKDMQKGDRTRVCLSLKHCMHKLSLK